MPAESRIKPCSCASIEILPAASGERVFVHLGPGPARDVISSLLYETSLDYILDAAHDDPDTLRRVVLTTRGQIDSSGDVVAGATNSGEGSGGEGSSLAANAHRGGVTDGLTRPEGVRMMLGWASSGMPTFQANAETALAAEQAAKERESAAAQESALRSKTLPRHRALLKRKALLRLACNQGIEFFFVQLGLGRSVGCRA